MKKIVLTPEVRSELLKLYKGLRVADVRDGMDWNMMHHYGTMTRDIRPLWRTSIMGFARTARYVKFQGPIPHMTPEEYTEWVGWYYGNVCTYPWGDDIIEDDVVVLDNSNVDVGLIGSANGLSYKSKGARGFIAASGFRDTDECILEQIPIWCSFVSQGMDQGRLQFDAKDIPVTVGGVVVNPGDIVLADNDGVIVVPLNMAYDVAKYAHQENSNDRKERGALYEAAGLKKDQTVD